MEIKLNETFMHSLNGCGVTIQTWQDFGKLNSKPVAQYTFTFCVLPTGFPGVMSPPLGIELLVMNVLFNCQHRPKLGAQEYGNVLEGICLHISGSTKEKKSLELSTISDVSGVPLIEINSLCQLLRRYEPTMRFVQSFVSSGANGSGMSGPLFQ